MIPVEIKRWFALGRGIGVEIAGPQGAESLEVTAVRVRPNGARVAGRLTIPDFARQPAALWGNEYANFARKLDLRYVAATVLLPRKDLIVRQLTLPGVSDKDLGSAIQFQMEGLHPYPEDDVVSSWARLPGTATVLVAIARRAAVDRYTSMFAEAGIKIGGFTCSAAAIYSALRLFGTPPPEILACESRDPQMEFYGESPAHPLFSASFDVQAMGTARAAALACSELRIDPATEPKPLEQVLSASAPALPYAAALASACPRLALSLNLLPVESRDSSARAMWVPSAVFGVAVVLLALAWVLFPGVEDRRYSRQLEAEIAKVQPGAARAAQIDRDIETARQRTLLLDQFRRRSQDDMDVLAELTRILPPPTWLNSLEVTRSQVTIGGETPQAAPLLKVIDSSPLFESSEFSVAPIHSQNGELFRIRANRRAPKP
jgi:Tfp pilus assembly protein PilN